MKKNFFETRKMFLEIFEKNEEKFLFEKVFFLFSVEKKIFFSEKFRCPLNCPFPKMDIFIFARIS